MRIFSLFNPKYKHFRRYTLQTKLKLKTLSRWIPMVQIKIVSFCFSLIKQNFQHVKVSNGVRVKQFLQKTFIVCSNFWLPYPKTMRKLCTLILSWWFAKKQKWAKHRWTLDIHPKSKKHYILLWTLHGMHRLYCAVNFTKKCLKELKCDRCQFVSKNGNKNWSSLSQAHLIYEKRRKCSAWAQILVAFILCRLPWHSTVSFSS